MVRVVIIAVVAAIAILGSRSHVRHEPIDDVHVIESQLLERVFNLVHRHGHVDGEGLGWAVDGR